MTPVRKLTGLGALQGESCARALVNSIGTIPVRTTRGVHLDALGVSRVERVEVPDRPPRANLRRARTRRLCARPGRPRGAALAGVSGGDCARRRPRPSVGLARRRRALLPARDEGRGEEQRERSSESSEHVTRSTAEGPPRSTRSTQPTRPAGLGHEELEDCVRVEPGARAPAAGGRDRAPRPDLMTFALAPSVPGRLAAALPHWIAWVRRAILVAHAHDLPSALAGAPRLVRDLEVLAAGLAGPAAGRALALHRRDAADAADAARSRRAASVAVRAARLEADAGGALRPGDAARSAHQHVGAIEAADLPRAAVRGVGARGGLLPRRLRARARRGRAGGCARRGHAGDRTRRRAGSCGCGRVRRRCGGPASDRRRHEQRREQRRVQRHDRRADHARGRLGGAPELLVIDIARRFSAVRRSRHGRHRSRRPPKPARLRDSQGHRRATGGRRDSSPGTTSRRHPSPIHRAGSRARRAS